MERIAPDRDTEPASVYAAIFASLMEIEVLIAELITIVAGMNNVAKEQHV